MLKYGINGKTDTIIKSMYTSNQCQIKFANGLSKPFSSSCGVKQGDILSPILFNIFVDDLVNELKSCPSDPIIMNGLSINSLLYADDIVLLANTQDGLQSYLNVLDKFCSTWKLEINTDKSKVVVFNSNGKRYMSTFQCAGRTLETVTSYCYLGVTFKYTGSLNNTSSLLMEKAKKAFFKIKKTVGLDNPCRLLEKLFDNLIAPVMLYCSEIWGILGTFNDSTPFEHLHMKFVKEILGVNSKSSNDACRAELNRLPLSCKALYFTSNYWMHLIASPNSLVSKILNITKPDNKWYIQLGKVFDKFGFSYLINSNNFNTCSLLSLKQRILDVHLQEQDMRIRMSNKLNFFRKFYSAGERPKYVDILRFKDERSSVTRLRISSHKLAIESGRYTNIPVAERFCQACNSNEIEDEEHFLLNCFLYKQSRQTLRNKIRNINNLEISTKILLDSYSPIILKLSSTFISNCWNQRGNKLREGFA